MSFVTIVLSLFALIAYCIKKKKYKQQRKDEAKIGSRQINQNINRKSSSLTIETNKVREKDSDPLPPDIVSHTSEVFSTAPYDFGKYLYNGDMKCINPNLSLNEQYEVFSYLPKLEMSRKFFTVSEELLGKGNFGKVFKGEAIGLFYPNSKTTVAIKTVNDTSSKSEVDSLLCEIKILSNLSLHLNLVNMMGACTTSPGMNKEIWLLLDFCEAGDMKLFVNENRTELEKCFSNYNKKAGDIHNRLLIKWAYHVAKGMEYLSSKQVMHGDLAARNILLSRGSKDSQLIA